MITASHVPAVFRLSVQGVAAGLSDDFPERGDVQSARASIVVPDALNVLQRMHLLGNITRRQSPPEDRIFLYSDVARLPPHDVALLEWLDGLGIPFTLWVA